MQQPGERPRREYRERGDEMEPVAVRDEERDDADRHDRDVAHEPAPRGAACPRPREAG